MRRAFLWSQLHGRSCPRAEGLPSSSEGVGRGAGRGALPAVLARILARCEVPQAQYTVSVQGTTPLVRVYTPAGSRLWWSAAAHRAASPKPALLILAARTDQPADGRSSCCRFGRASLAAGRRQPGPGWPPGTDRQIPPRERNARKAAHNGSEQRALAADGRKGLPVGLAAESQRAPPIIPRTCTCASAAGAHTCTGHTGR